MGKITSDTGKSAKNLARQAARQIAREPLEVLKQAGKQVAGQETAPTPEPQSFQPGVGQEVSPTKKQEIQKRDTRLIQALEQELKDIKNQKEFEEAKKKEEERHVLEEKAEAGKPVPQISSKRSRKLFGFGAKQKAESLKTRIEKPLPPTG